MADRGRGSRFWSQVERAVSHFYHAKKRDAGALSIDESIDRRQKLEQRRSPLGYVYRSQYEKHLRRYIDRFGRDKNHIMIFEELIQAPRAVLGELHTFLGLDVPKNLALPHSNKAPEEIVAEHSAPDKSVERLADLLAPTVTAVEDLIGRQLPAWKS